MRPSSTGPEQPVLGPLAFFGHLWGETPSTFHAVRLIARYFRGVTTLEDGLGGLTRTAANGQLPAHR